MFNGTVHIVYDGQAGSCGKGKFVGYLARNLNISVSINNNMPNAGHSFKYDDGKKVVTTHLPIAVVNPNIPYLVIGAGAAIDPEVLKRELKQYADIIGDRKIYIHERAAIVLPKHKQTEMATIRSGSTFKGSAAAVVDKIMRREDVRLAKQYFLGEKHTLISQMLKQSRNAYSSDFENTLIEYITDYFDNKIDYEDLRIFLNSKCKNCDVGAILDLVKEDALDLYNKFEKLTAKDYDWGDKVEIVDDSFIESVMAGKNGFTGNENILIETSQGFDLDINHGLDYPNVTSRQCTPAQALADCGIPHNVKTKTYMVFRPYPIRISNSTQFGIIYCGDYDDAKEITWEEVAKNCYAYENLAQLEQTTVTKRTRRVFEFSDKRFRRAINITNPDYLILNFSQYINYFGKGYNNKLLNEMFKRFKSENEDKWADGANALYPFNQISRFCNDIEHDYGKEVLFIGTGEGESEIINYKKLSKNIKNEFNNCPGC